MQEFEIIKDLETVIGFMNRVTGTLRKIGDTVCIQNAEGDHFKNRLIWDGYIHHWLGQEVYGKELEQCDYDTNEKIIILWPNEEPSSEPFVEFYYNERLIKYPASLFGHNAININGHIYNFSHLLNENEIMTPEEFFYRPALGEFSPSPNNNKFEILDDGRAYYDKFGRNFMRTIHVIKMHGMDTEKLKSILDHELDVIRATPVDPSEPEKYKDFSFFTRSCSTIIRDGLIKYGLKNIDGIIPRDLFVNILYSLYTDGKDMGLEWELYKKPQLKVPEAPFSKMTPLLNMKNRWYYKMMKANKAI